MLARDMKYLYLLRVLTACTCRPACSGVRRRGGGAGDQRGVQDLEEEHPVPLRPGDDACAGVAQPHRAVAA